MNLEPIFQLGAVFLLILLVIAIVLVGPAALRMAGQAAITALTLLVSLIRLPFDMLSRFLRGK